MEKRQREWVVITGSSGRIGRALVQGLGDYEILALDQADAPCPDPRVHCLPLDIASEDSLREVAAKIRTAFSHRIASVIHLAAYYSFSGDPDPRYHTVNVLGTTQLLRALQALEVEQFIFTSSMLVHAPTLPWHPIREDSPLAPAWDYPQSKRAAEEAVRREHGRTPYAILRLAGVYTDQGELPALAQQIQRISERRLVGRLFPGDSSHGQAAVHLDDVVELVAALVAQRRRIPPDLVLLAGEPETPGYAQLQAELGRLLHGEPWETREIPKALAKTGAWLGEVALPKEEEPFIKHWMIDLADDHYELDVSRAEAVLGWKPRRRLLERLPRIVESLQRDPAAWYAANQLEGPPAQPSPAAGADAGTRDAEPPPEPAAADAAAGTEGHCGAGGRAGPGGTGDLLLDMHLGMLWPHYVNLALGAWLLTAPFLLGYGSSLEPDANLLRTMLERGLASAEERNRLLAWSDFASGLLVVLFSLLSADPRRRYSWSQWANAAVGTWLMFAPLLFWTPLPEAYAQDTLLGALVIAFAVLIPMMPGMSREGMRGGPDIPPGWDYCPSTYAQRFPIAALGFVGLLIARYLAAYQLGHLDRAWDPFFGAGTMTIISSEASQAWPVADAGVGAVAYMLEVLMAAMGDKRRWRTMPWMVLGFGILVVPLGGVSIFFIIIQPIVIGTWCSLCLLAALAMLIMIPYSLDELVATGQFLVDARRRGRPFWRCFWMGDAMPGGRKDRSHSFSAGPRVLFGEMLLGGVTLPWTLLASSAVGVWLMFTRLAFDSSGALANSDHLIGSLVVTISISALAEVARALRFLNLAFGAWLIAAPWLLQGGGAAASWNGVVCGLLLIALAIPRGAVRNHYGSWDRYVV